MLKSVELLKDNTIGKNAKTHDITALKYRTCKWGFKDKMSHIFSLCKVTRSSLSNLMWVVPNHLPGPNVIKPFTAIIDKCLS